MGSSETCPPVVNNTGQQQTIFLPVPEPSLSILSLQEKKKKKESVWRGQTCRRLPPGSRSRNEIITP